MDDKGDEWEYNAIGDTYFIGGQQIIHLGILLGGKEIHTMAVERRDTNWAKVALGHRCNHQETALIS